MDVTSRLNRVSENEISTYVHTILGDATYTITDVFNREKQLTLVECPTEISILFQEFFMM